MIVLRYCILPKSDKRSVSVIREILHVTANCVHGHRRGSTRNPTIKSSNYQIPLHTDMGE